VSQASPALLGRAMPNKRLARDRTSAGVVGGFLTGAG
jgi:hypothetical protein